jgi:predicted secreted Zn-dependent protease
MVPSTASRWGGWLGLVALCALLVAGLLVGWPALPGATAGIGEPHSDPSVLAGAGQLGAGPGGALLVPAGAETVVTAPSDTSADHRPAIRRTGVSVTASTRFYEVEGADARSLLASLGQRGPRDGHETWAASTAWVLRWSYQPVAGLDCRIDAARVELDLTYTYPRWSAPASATPALAAAWDGYLAQVELHEQGHREIAEGAASDLARALEALPAQATCAALAGTARAAAGDLLARHAQAQAAYDRATEHGVTQGAVLSLDR